MSVVIDVDPYWVNAANWWLNNRNDDVIEFNDWLAEQGVIIIERKQFTPYIEFDCPLSATLFKMKWSNL